MSSSKVRFSVDPSINLDMKMSESSSWNISIPLSAETANPASHLGLAHHSLSVENQKRKRMYLTHMVPAEVLPQEDLEKDRWLNPNKGRDKDKDIATATTQLHTITRKMFNVLGEYDHQMRMREWENVDQIEEDSDEIKAHLIEMLSGYQDHCKEREHLLHALADWFSGEHSDLTGSRAAQKYYAMKLRQKDQEKKIRYKSKLQTRKAIQDAIEEVMKTDLPPDEQDQEKEMLRKEFMKSMQEQDSTESFEEQTTGMKLGLQKSNCDTAIQQWKAAAEKMCNFLKGASTEEIEDSVTFDRKMDKLVDTIDNQSSLFDMLTSEIQEQKRLIIVANTAIENLTEQNAELNQELSVLDEDLNEAKSTIRGLELRCKDAIPYKMNKSTDMSKEMDKNNDYVKELEVVTAKCTKEAAELRKRTSDIERENAFLKDQCTGLKKQYKEAVDLFDDEMDAHKKEMLRLMTGVRRRSRIPLLNGGKIGITMETTSGTLLSGDVDGTNGTMEQSDAGVEAKKTKGKKRAEKKPKKRKISASLISFQLERILNKEHKLSVANEEIEKLRGEIEQLRQTNDPDADSAKEKEGEADSTIGESIKKDSSIVIKIGNKEGTKNTGEKMRKEDVEGSGGTDNTTEQHPSPVEDFTYTDTAILYMMDSVIDDEDPFSKTDISIASDTLKLLQQLKLDVDTVMIVAVRLKYGECDFSSADGKSLIKIRDDLLCVCEHIASLMECSSNTRLLNEESEVCQESYNPSGDAEENEATASFMKVKSSHQGKQHASSTKITFPNAVRNDGAVYQYHNKLIDEVERTRSNYLYKRRLTIPDKLKDASMLANRRHSVSLLDTRIKTYMHPQNLTGQQDLTEQQNFVEGQNYVKRQNIAKLEIVDEKDDSHIYERSPVAVHPVDKGDLDQNPFYHEVPTHRTDSNFFRVRQAQYANEHNVADSVVPHPPPGVPNHPASLGHHRLSRPFNLTSYLRPHQQQVHTTWKMPIAQIGLDPRLSNFTTAAHKSNTDDFLKHQRLALVRSFKHKPMRSYRDNLPIEIDMHQAFHKPKQWANSHSIQHSPSPKSHPTPGTFLAKDVKLPDLQK